MADILNKSSLTSCNLWDSTNIMMTMWKMVLAVAAKIRIFTDNCLSAFRLANYSRCKWIFDVSLLGETPNSTLATVSVRWTLTFDPHPHPTLNIHSYISGNSAIMSLAKWGPGIPEGSDNLWRPPSSPSPLLPLTSSTNIPWLCIDRLRVFHNQ